MATGLLPPGLMLDSKSDSEEHSSLCKVVTDWLLFYMTAFFVLLTIFSILSLIFLVPFFIDPAWSTLQADFEPQGILCTTISAEYKEGKSNCDWSSCEEGCTKTIYTCWQILGCGYPPNTICTDFVDKYKQEGTRFTCYVSKKMPDVVLVDLDLDHVRLELFYCLAVPIPCLFISVVYLVVAYFYIYNDSPVDRTNTYHPMAMLSSAATMTALIDVGSKDMNEHERQRKRLLLQAQRAKLLAQGRNPGTTGLMIRSAMLSSATSAVSLSDGLHLGKAPALSIPLKEAATKLNDQKLNEMVCDIDHLEKVKKDRQEYSKDRQEVFHYYHYYNMY
eukprot:TCALIF_00087-PA protein Name:"Similar to tipE Protein tipE (Drosophila melanogaster)" AED:0.07 eAED:0.07 QI:331/0.8/0.66/1/0.4/0.5/6/5/332